MQRCLQLAEMGAGHVAPNPMVGAVLVYNDRVIGEGYHMQYGGPHAEVNCINSVSNEDVPHIPESTLYVSLEPCVHFGITPPCTDLIIFNNIPNVVIGCRDSFPEVDGKGIEKLKGAGVNVLAGVLEKECLQLNKRFFTFHDLKRPYIILKWAQSADGKIGPPLNPPEGGTLESAVDKRLMISNGFTNRLVHKWRSEEAAIMVGTNTALQDNPQLTTRLWPGKDPVRVVIDKELKLPASLKLFDKSARTIVFNDKKQEDDLMLGYYQLDKKKDDLLQMMEWLYKEKLQSVMIEGGAKLLQSFIDKGLWDEARVINNEQLTIGNGVEAPVLSNHELIREERIDTDVISFFVKKDSK
jgi:diaminohydroxyphosphoribosylaminopyrimidine deaminase/5-amino-6-(5-phosphoribosylamino)uracil reductase